MTTKLTHCQEFLIIFESIINFIINCYIAYLLWNYQIVYIFNLPKLTYSQMLIIRYTIGILWSDTIDYRTYLYKFEGLENLINDVNDRIDKIIDKKHVRNINNPTINPIYQPINNREQLNYSMV